MKIAVIGSRRLKIDSLDGYLPSEADEIVSGGAVGIDTYARKYAEKKSLKLTEFLPEYEKYGRGAPIVRNKKIVEYADEVIAFWDGESRGTLSVIKYCQKLGKTCKVVKI